MRLQIFANNLFFQWPLRLRFPLINARPEVVETLNHPHPPDVVRHPLVAGARRDDHQALGAHEDQRVAEA
jgi:hypothetical protein